MTTSNELSKRQAQRGWNGVTRALEQRWPRRRRWAETFPGTKQAVSAARKWAVATVGADSPHAYAVELITSELVTNAVVHPASGEGGHVRVRIKKRRGGIEISVCDQGSRLTARQASRLTARIPSDLDEHCRGLLIVKEMSQRWGVDPTRRGLRVWAYLAADPEPATTT